jgi:hypothetical protein
MKPWEAPLNKPPRKGGMEEQRDKTQVRATRAKPKVGHKGANEQIMFQSPHQLQEAYKVLLAQGACE